MEPQCIEYYKNKTFAREEDGIKLRFPDTGQQCFFTESIYPLKPWPVGCKIYHANDFCSTYEISDEGNYVQSCDLAMITGQCLTENSQINTCVEFCPEGGCLYDNAKHMAVNLILMISSMALMYVAI